MCGIAGIVATHALQPDDRRRVVRMRDVIAHRGPDGAGLFADDRAALGHRRLSIVDLAGGAQPLANEDETIQVVFNGEIYNHADLRPQLESAGHRYRTRSDTETIVHAYEQWGDACVERFRGMFAFAIWDGPRRRLLLARDRLGVKPLYWARAGDRLLFASEIKAILESGLIEARANEDVLPEVLATRATAGEETLFRGVHKLMPGHVLTFAGGQVQQRRYWDVPAAPEPGAPVRSRAEEVEAFRALLDESVRVRLMSDVPLGVFLSGGIDSSAIAGLMARRVGRLQTFSVAFEDRACNELEYAREVAHAIGAENHEVIVGEGDFFGALPRLIWHEDEPIAHPSSVPLYFVSELARRHVKVVLTGEGSDELLAGYGKYPRALLNWRLGQVYAATVPAAMRRGLAGLGAATAGESGSLRAAIVRRRRARAGHGLLRQLRRGERRAAAPAPVAAAAVDAPRTGLWRGDGGLRPAIRGPAAAGSPPLRRPQDLPGRAAHEAGPDEHGGVDREPGALPRPSPGRVRLAPGARSQTVGIHDQAHPA